jgi:hypothetical protein
MSINFFKVHECLQSTFKLFVVVCGRNRFSIHNVCDKNRAILKVTKNVARRSVDIKKFRQQPTSKDGI